MTLKGSHPYNMMSDTPANFLLLSFGRLNILIYITTLISFSEYFRTANELEYLFNKNDTIEEFLEDVSASGMSVPAVSTSDIAVNVLPLSLLKRKKPIRYDELKKSKQATEFIDENLDKYKSLYKKNAESILYSVAEHLFLKK